MLVLSRKAGERITVGDDIIIQILSIHNRYLRIGITAPESLQILRDDAVCKRKRDREGQVSSELLARNAREKEL